VFSVKRYVVHFGVSIYSLGVFKDGRACMPAYEVLRGLTLLYLYERKQIMESQDMANVF
jgi:hypothetical protein